MKTPSLPVLCFMEPVDISPVCVKLCPPPVSLSSSSCIGLCNVFTAGECAIHLLVTDVPWTILHMESYRVHQCCPTPQAAISPSPVLPYTYMLAYVPSLTVAPVLLCGSVLTWPHSYRFIVNTLDRCIHGLHLIIMITTVCA